MSKYLSGPKAGNILVDTINEQGDFDVLPLHSVLNLAAKQGQGRVLFLEPYGMVEASARILKEQEYDAEGTVISRTSDGTWSFLAPQKLDL